MAQNAMKPAAMSAAVPELNRTRAAAGMTPPQPGPGVSGSARAACPAQGRAGAKSTAVYAGPSAPPASGAQVQSERAMRSGAGSWQGPYQAAGSSVSPWPQNTAKTGCQGVTDMGAAADRQDQLPGMPDGTVQSQQPYNWVPPYNQAPHVLRGTALNHAAVAAFPGWGSDNAQAAAAAAAAASTASSVAASAAGAVAGAAGAGDRSAVSTRGAAGGAAGAQMQAANRMAAMPANGYMSVPVDTYSFMPPGMSAAMNMGQAAGCVAPVPAGGGAAGALAHGRASLPAGAVARGTVPWCGTAGAVVPAYAAQPAAAGMMPSAPGSAAAKSNKPAQPVMAGPAAGAVPYGGGVPGGSVNGRVPGGSGAKSMPGAQTMAGAQSMPGAQTMAGAQSMAVANNMTALQTQTPAQAPAYAPASAQDRGLAAASALASPADAGAGCAGAVTGGSCCADVGSEGSHGTAGALARSMNELYDCVAGNTHISVRGGVQALGVRGGHAYIDSEDGGCGAGGAGSVALSGMHSPRVIDCGAGVGRREVSAAVFDCPELGDRMLTVPEHKDMVSAMVPQAHSSYVFESKALKTMLDWLEKPHGDSLYICGPSGCGKTSFVLETAARLKWPVESITLSQTSEVSDLIGHPVIRHGQLHFEYGPLSRAMMSGEILLLNEIDLMSAGELAALNDVLEGRGLTVIASNGEVIMPHPGFRVIATGNSRGSGDSSGHYTGVRRQNTAFLDRWVFLEFAWPDFAMGRSIISRAVPELNPDLIRYMLTFVHELRIACGAERSSDNRDMLENMRARIAQLHSSYVGCVEECRSAGQVRSIEAVIGRSDSTEADITTEYGALNNVSDMRTLDDIEISCGRRVLPLSAPVTTRSLLRICRAYAADEKCTIQDAIDHAFASRLEGREYAFVMRMSFEVFGYTSKFTELPHCVSDVEAYLKMRARTFNEGFINNCLLPDYQLREIFARRRAATAASVTAAAAAAGAAAVAAKAATAEVKDSVEGVANEPDAGDDGSKVAAPEGARAAQSSADSANAAQCKAEPGLTEHETGKVTPGSPADNDREIVSPLENLNDSQSVATQGYAQYESSAKECSTAGQAPELKSCELKGSERERVDLSAGCVISAGNISVETVLVDDYGSEAEISSVRDEPLLTAVMAGTAGDEPAGVSAEGHGDEAEAGAATKAVRPVRRSRSRKVQPANAKAADGDMAADTDSGADTGNDALTAGSELEALTVTDEQLSNGSSAAVALEPVRKVRRSRKSDKAPAA